MDWYTFIASVAASVVVAIMVPTLFLWWTKPRIKVFFTCIPYDGLICMIQNTPNGNLPTTLGIQRQDIVVSQIKLPPILKVMFHPVSQVN